VIPFPGESLGLFYAWSTVDGDATLGGEIHYRAGEPGFTGNATLPAGEQWRVWVAPGSGTYLEEPGLDLDIAWVVEVDSGTVTLSASEGLDPDYGEPTATAPTALGSHTVTGPATLVIPSALTSTQVWGDAAGAFMLVLDATSGSAVVSQVKLRAWPAEGVAGGWSDLNPSFDTTPFVPTRRRHTVSGFTGGTGPDGLATPEDAWAFAVAAYHADVTARSGPELRGFSTAPGSLIAASQDIGLATLSTYSAALVSNAEMHMLYGADPTGIIPIDTGPFDEGEEWIRPPAEVAGDLARYVQADESPVTRWSGAVEVGMTGAVPGDATLRIEGGDWADEDPGSGRAYTLAFSHSPAASPGFYPVPDMVPMVLVEASHTAATGAADTYPGYPPGGISNDSVGAVSFATVQTFVTMPPYRYWSPTAVPVAVVEPLRLRQRSDGLGLGSIRVRGIGSRQHSPRVRGYL
jgi:hypothetical protein